jgi:ABC-type multidrug transport system ATPase subunit
MEEAERLCDRIVIVDHGKVVASDTRGFCRRRRCWRARKVPYAYRGGANHLSTPTR